MNKYAKGYRKEILARRHLKRRGWLVFRAAGSKGPVDLVAVGYKTRLIQVTTNYCSPAKKRKFLRDTLHFPAIKEIWTYKDKTTIPKVEVYLGGGWLDLTSEEFRR